MKKGLIIAGGLAGIGAIAAMLLAFFHNRGYNHQRTAR